MDGRWVNLDKFNWSRKGDSIPIGWEVGGPRFISEDQGPGTYGIADEWTPRGGDYLSLLLRKDVLVPIG